MSISLVDLRDHCSCPVGQGYDPFLCDKPKHNPRRPGSEPGPVPTETPRPEIPPRIVIEPPSEKPQRKEPFNPRPTKKPANRKQRSNNGWNLERRREWYFAVSRAFTPSRNTLPVRLAGAYVLHADSDGQMFVGSTTLSGELGISEKRIKDGRGLLVEFGWLVDTGNRRGRAIVYRLANGDTPDQ